MYRLSQRIGLYAMAFLAACMSCGLLMAQPPRGDRDRDRGEDRGSEFAPGGFPGREGGERGGFPGGRGGGFPGGPFPGGPFPGGPFPEGRGGGPFGGGPFGGGPFGGGPFGGGPFGRGPFGGGPFGGNPADFLGRFDRNGNGVLEPDETEGRVRGFLERITSGIGGVNLDRPIRIDQLARAMERMRQEGGGRDPRNEGEGRGEQAGSSSGSGSEPLVPGFGIELDLPPVPGFGSDAAAVLIKIEEADRRQAEERVRRYDRNGDGMLSKEELQEGRWSDDPMQYDRNRDGRLTVDELAMRYAKRRVAETTSRNQNASASSTTQKPPQKFYIPSSSGSGSSSAAASAASSGSSAATPIDERAARFADFMLRRMDANGNGRLERDEWGEMLGGASSYDSNRDGVIDRDELVRGMANRNFGGGFFGQRGDQERGRGEGERGMFFFSRGEEFRGGGRGEGGLGGGRADRADRRERSESNGPRFFTPAVGSGASGNTASGTNAAAPSIDFAKSRLTPQERLQQSDSARELPDWFIRNDADQDAQIAMHEFSTSWSDEVVADYFKFDLNQDGFITVDECLTAVRQGATRGAAAGETSASRDSRPSFFSRNNSNDRSGSNSRDSNSSATSANNTTNTSSGETSSSASTGDATTDRYLQYARGVIQRYDKNRDGMLDRNEWSAVSGNVAAADQDGDGKITAEEYATFLRRR